MLCGAVLTTNGKRCHDCVAKLGHNAAAILRAGHTPVEVAAALDYPSPDGVVRLAVTHGGYGQAWPQRVMATFRHLFRSSHRHMA